MIKVNTSTQDMARWFDRAMNEKRKDGHAFIAMDIPGMETVCDVCYSAHKVGA
jgi:hypothetical protein